MLGSIINQAPILTQRFSSALSQGVVASTKKIQEDIVSLKKTQEELATETNVAVVGIGGCLSENKFSFFFVIFIF